jgi:hypothetical protein
MYGTSLLQNEPEAEDRAEDQGFSITDDAILDALEMMPFISIRQIAKMTFIPPTTGFRRLTKSVHFVLKRLCWIPHKLSDLQKQARIIMSKELLKLLEFMRHHSWKYIMTLDEAWFDFSIFLSFYLSIFLSFYSTDRESIWLSPEDKFHKGRVIFKDDANGRLEPTWISLD